MKKEEKKERHLKLDTAALMFPLAYSPNQRSLARLSVTLSENVIPENLQIALHHLFHLFPSIYVRLRRSAFQYYFEKLSEAPQIKEENDGEKPLNMGERDFSKSAFKVFYAGNKISFEFFHALSDGYGGSVFLKALVAEYLHLTYGLILPASSDIISPHKSDNQISIADRYLEITGKRSKIKNLSASYTFSAKVAPRLNITTFTYKTSHLISCARKYGVTLTALLTAVLNTAINALKEKKNNLEVRFSVPVNLRNIYNLDTMRNFTAPITLFAGKERETSSFPALCTSFDQQLKTNVTKDNLSALVTTYVKMSKSKIFAILPLGLKKSIVKSFFGVFKNGNTMTISNLGVFDLPQNMLPFVKEASIILSPKPATPYGFSVLSLANVLTIAVTRSIEDQGLENKVKEIIDGLLTNHGKMETII